MPNLCLKKFQIIRTCSVAERDSIPTPRIAGSNPLLLAEILRRKEDVGIGVYMTKRRMC